MQYEYDHKTEPWSLLGLPNAFEVQRDVLQFSRTNASDFCVHHCSSNSQSCSLKYLRLGSTPTWIKPQLPSWGVPEIDTIPITNVSPTVEGGKRPRIHRFLVECWTILKGHFTYSQLLVIKESCWSSHLQYMFILLLNSHWLVIVWDDSTTGFSWWWLTNRWCYDVKIYRIGHTHHPWRTWK